MSQTLVFPTQMNPKVHRMALVGILVLYIIAALLHAFMVPTGQTGYQDAPDEAAHMSYIKTLSNGYLPTYRDMLKDHTGKSYEWHQPPLYYLICLPFVSMGTHGIRCISIMMGECTLILLYLLMRVMFPEQGNLALLATAFAAFLPGNVAITSAVNNDVLVELLFTAAILMLALRFKNGPALLNTIITGILLGLALLTKVNGLILVPIIVVWHFRSRDLNAAVKSWLKQISLLFFISFVVSGWWYVRNMMMYHQLYPTSKFTKEFHSTALASSFISKIGLASYWELVTKMSFQSFWATYGSPASAKLGIPLYLQPQIYEIALLISVISIIGMTKLHFQRSKLFTLSQQSFFQMLIAIFLLVMIGFIVFLNTYFQTQGRYLYPALAPIAIYVSFGWVCFFPDKYRVMASLFLVLYMVMFLVIFLTAVHTQSIAS